MTRYLLDTQVLLRWAMSPDVLSDASHLAIANGHSTIYVSAATAWEIAIKRRIGKLDVPGNVASLAKENRFLELPVTFQHAEATHSLPMHHKDPIDRLLVAQAKADGLTLITRDQEIVKYDIPTLAA